MATRPPELDFFNISDIARICKVSVKTATRWKLGQSVPPATSLMVLGRDLGCLHPDWSGWTISGRGELCSPENWISTPGSVRASKLMNNTVGAYQRDNQYLRAAVRSLEAKVTRLENAWAQVEDQPLPAQWDIEVG